MRTFRCLIPPLLGLILSLLKTPTSTASGVAVCVSLGNIGGFVGPSALAWSYTASRSYGPACVALAACAFAFGAGMWAFRRRLCLYDFDFAPQRHVTAIAADAPTASLAI
jgi:nitrate/nitrite transporter NarK